MFITNMMRMVKWVIWIFFCTALIEEIVIPIANMDMNKNCQRSVKAADIVIV